jgi:DNA mismatch repair protein MutS
LSCLAKTLALLPKLKARLSGRQSALICDLEGRLELLPDLRAEIDAALVDEPPLAVTDGGLIRDGYNAQLDEWRDLARGGKEWIARYQAEEIERTGIPNLKVGFNRVFGYYLECTAAQADKVPADYIRKQTLKNQERFITPQLKEHEEKVLRAEGQAIQLEQELFAALRDRVGQQSPRLKENAEILAELDVLVGLATLAVNARYCRPEITDEPILDIREGRHPVLDRLHPSGEFVPNDVQIGHSFGRVQLITGPNMAGKSTYIRQAALLCILAQMGSFVPASEARIGLADRIFARVGASDELGRGQSTFMVEMTETARILNAATPRSLVILDEIGRGTSTYDGISLAWAITEYLHDRIRCRTLFATHYHELTQLAETLSDLRNENVAVREQGDGVIFLHKIVPGAADKSYGIHVARLAGVPREVLHRAEVVLETLETDHLDAEGRPKMPARNTRSGKQKQLSLFGPDDHPVLDALRQINVNELTPIAALQQLQSWQEQLQVGQEFRTIFRNSN